MTRALVIAHRGASGYAPENTFAAFDLAVEQRADMIELDLHLCADDSIAVQHDARHAKLGALAHATREQLRAHGVPLLEEVLDRYAARIALNLELKHERGARSDGLCARVLEQVTQRAELSRILFSSFEVRLLRELHALEPRARIGLLFTRESARHWPARARELKACALHPPAALTDANLLRAAHELRLKVYAFTVDDPAEMQRLLTLGADGLFTNLPDVMHGVLDERTKTSV